MTLILPYYYSNEQTVGILFIYIRVFYRLCSNGHIDIFVTFWIDPRQVVSLQLVCGVYVSASCSIVLAMTVDRLGGLLVLGFQNGYSELPKCNIRLCILHRNNLCMVLDL